jgi:Asp-tRNA(Asn)/Glu-tRNA(Gln) amidotransferase A subunit family amidase
MSVPSPERLTAVAARRAIADGTLTATRLLEACLERIAARNGTVAAWAFLDVEGARARAKALDAGPQGGLLHGIPFGVKDIIDADGMPAGYGSAIYAGHRPGRDAATVALPRAAGAVLLGKTVTTEFANRAPGATRNPHDPTRTPGGSSSGSAAAVADFQVPLALGTQTGGSVLRPASYCGIVGFKPSFQHLGNGGVRANTEAFDTVGLMARRVEDIALLRAACMAIPFVAPAAPAPPRIAIARTAHWDRAAPDSQAAVENAAALLARAGAEVSDLDLPPDFAALEAAHRLACAFEAPRSYADELARSAHLLSPDFRDERCAEGQAASLAAFRAALRAIRAARGRMQAMMQERRLDALLTPAAPGEAPPGQAQTGSHIFNYLWTALHMPSVTLPGATGPNGLPVGVQLVAPAHHDAPLLDLAAWAERVLAG